MVAGEAGGKASPTGVDQLGFTRGMVVQELGWDSDVDDSLRSAIMDVIDGDLVEDAIDSVEAVILWWREEDGDVVDGLVDALPDLTDSGYIWLFTPKLGRAGYIDPADLAEGALAAGLALTSTATVSKTWQAHRLVRPRGNRR